MYTVNRMPIYQPAFGPPADREQQELYHHRDLRNPRSFPSFEDCAPYKAYPAASDHEHPHHYWCFLGQILPSKTETEEHSFLVKDKSGETVRVELAFPDDDASSKFEAEYIKPGWTLAVLWAAKNVFEDGTSGLRLEYPQFVKTFPCDLATLLRINEDIIAQTPVASLRRCIACGKEEEVDRVSLQQCPRCWEVSFCIPECAQHAVWEQQHQASNDCAILPDVMRLKRPSAPGTNAWAGFAEHEDALALHDQAMAAAEANFHVEETWKDAEPLRVEDLQETFAIESGEIVWGTLHGVASGLLFGGCDQPSTQDNWDVGGGTVYKNALTYRAPAKVGIWKITKVAAHGWPDRPLDSWLAYHSSCSPAALIRLSRGVEFQTRTSNPRVGWINRYDWSTLLPTRPRDIVGRLFSALDPGSGWPATMERERLFFGSGGSPYDSRRDSETRPDRARVERIQNYGNHNVFVLDAEHAPALMKTLARPCIIDDKLPSYLDYTSLGPDRATTASSTLFSGAGSGGVAVGCNLAFMGPEYVQGRLIFSDEDVESQAFPGKKIKELVGFWYDDYNSYLGDAEYMQRDLGEPRVEGV